MCAVCLAGEEGVSELLMRRGRKAYFIQNPVQLFHLRHHLQVCVSCSIEEGKDVSEDIISGGRKHIPH
jgi:hypothetical protein